MEKTEAIDLNNLTCALVFLCSFTQQQAEVGFSPAEST